METNTTDFCENNVTDLPMLKSATNGDLNPDDVLNALFPECENFSVDSFSNIFQKKKDLQSEDTMNGHTNSFEELSSQLEKLKEIIKELKEKNMTQEEMIAKYEADLSNRMQELFTTSQELDILKKKFQTIESENIEMKVKLSHLEAQVYQLGELKIKREELEATIADLQKELSSKERTQNRLKSELTDKNDLVKRTLQDNRNLWNCLMNVRNTYAKTGRLSVKQREKFLNVKAKDPNFWGLKSAELFVSSYESSTASNNADKQSGDENQATPSKKQVESNLPSCSVLETDCANNAAEISKTNNLAVSEKKINASPKVKSFSSNYLMKSSRDVIEDPHVSDDCLDVTIKELKDLRRQFSVPNAHFAPISPLPPTPPPKTNKLLHHVSSSVLGSPFKSVRKLNFCHQKSESFEVQSVPAEKKANLFAEKCVNTSLPKNDNSHFRVSTKNNPDGSVKLDFSSHLNSNISLDLTNYKVSCTIEPFHATKAENENLPCPSSSSNQNSSASASSQLSSSPLIRSNNETSSRDFKSKSERVASKQDLCRQNCINDPSEEVLPNPPKKLKLDDVNSLMEKQSSSVILTDNSNLKSSEGSLDSTQKTSSEVQLAEGELLKLHSEGRKNPPNTFEGNDKLPSAFTTPPNNFLKKRREKDLSSPLSGSRSESAMEISDSPSEISVPKIVLENVFGKQNNSVHVKSPQNASKSSSAEQENSEIIVSDGEVTSLYFPPRLSSACNRSKREKSLSLSSDEINSSDQTSPRFSRVSKSMNKSRTKKNKILETDESQSSKSDSDVMTDKVTLRQSKKKRTKGNTTRERTMSLHSRSDLVEMDCDSKTNNDQDILQEKMGGSINNNELKTTLNSEKSEGSVDENIPENLKAVNTFCDKVEFNYSTPKTNSASFCKNSTNVIQSNNNCLTDVKEILSPISENTNNHKVSCSSEKVIVSSKNNESECTNLNNISESVMSMCCDLSQKHINNESGNESLTVELTAKKKTADFNEILVPPLDNTFFTSSVLVHSHIKSVESSYPSMNSDLPLKGTPDVEGTLAKQSIGMSPNHFLNSSVDNRLSDDLKCATNPQLQSNLSDSDKKDEAEQLVNGNKVQTQLESFTPNDNEKSEDSLQIIEAKKINLTVTKELLTLDSNISDSEHSLVIAENADDASTAALLDIDDEGNQNDYSTKLRKRKKSKRGKSQIKRVVKRKPSDTTPPQEVGTIESAFKALNVSSFTDSNMKQNLHTLVNALINPDNAPTVKDIVLHVLRYLHTTRHVPMMAYLVDPRPEVLLPPTEKVIVRALLIVSSKKKLRLRGFLDSVLNTSYMLILTKEDFTIYGLCSLCRTLTELCKVLKDKKRPAMLCGELLKMNHIYAPYLIASVASIWRELFDINNATEEEKLYHSTIAYGVLKKPATLTDTQWKQCKNVLNSHITAPILRDIDNTVSSLICTLQTRCVKDELDENVFLLATPLVIIAAHEGFEWTKTNLIVKHLIPLLYQYSEQDPNEKAFQVFCNLYADVCLLCEKESDTNDAHDVLYSFFKDGALTDENGLIIDNFVTDSVAVAQGKLYLLKGELLPTHLTEWIKRNQDDPEKKKHYMVLFNQRLSMDQNSVLLESDIFENCEK